MIDSRAVIDASAKIAENVTISPFAVIGANVEIGEGTWVGPSAFIKGRTKIGRNNKIFQFASLGEDPQDKKYGGEDTLLEIGDNNIFREFCTVNRGTAQDRGFTKIGDHNLIMSYVHIAHDCVIGDHTIFTNTSSLAGHVTVDDYAILGGYAAIYQFCHLGTHCFVVAGAMVVKDVLPFTRVSGVYAEPCGLNIEGLRRRGFTQELRNKLKEAYRIIYRQGLTAAEAIARLEPMAVDCPEIGLYVEMLKTAKFGVAR